MKECQTLCREFNLYVVLSKSLRKVFLSIKGIYYQAEIMGQPITWIQPYQFIQKLPADVDYKVMQTFLEFYITLLKFTNLKLFKMLNIQYPLSLNESQEKEHYQSLRSLITKNIKYFFQSVTKKSKQKMNVMRFPNSSNKANTKPTIFSKDSLSL